MLGYPIRFRMDNDLTNTAEDLMIDVSDFVQR
jgi:hypothetical protein